jgi:MFS family permease
MGRQPAVSANPISPEGQRNLRLTGWTSLMTDFSSQMVFPLLPLFLVGSVGGSPAIVGAVEGAADAVAAAIKLFSGRRSDVSGKRKPWMVAGYGLSAITKVLFAFATGWLFVLIARVVERIGKGLRTAPRDALVAESVGMENLGRAYGYQRMMDALGSVLGALAAAVLLGFMDVREVFVVALLPGALAMFFVLRVRETVHRDAAIVTKPHTRAPLPMAVKLAIAGCAVFAFGRMGYAFVLLKASGFGLSLQQCMLAYALYQLLYTLVASPWGRLADRLGMRTVLGCGYALFALALVALAFASNTTALLLAFCLYGIGEAAIDSSQRGWLAQLAPSSARGAVMGALHASIALVALPGGLIIGLIFEHIDPAAAFLWATLLTVLAAAALVLKSRPVAAGSVTP